MSIYRSTNRPEALSAKEASALLGVKRATLYTYVSRGWIRTLPGKGRAKAYLYADVLDVKRRAEAHRGEEAAAVGALHWGAPVLTSAITSIDIDGPNYRGTPAVTLAESDASFESVCSVLWECPFDDHPPTFGGRGHGHPIDVFQRATLDAAVQDPCRYDGDDARAGSVLLRGWLRALGAPAASGAADALVTLWGLPAGSRPAIDAALVLCADHELNASTFAARVTASTGADTYAAVLSALAALSGPRHGGLSDQVEAWYRRPGDHLVEDTLRMGDRPPGLGHPLYPAGDPRAAHLLVRALAHGTSAACDRLSSRLARLEAHGLPAPSLDFGLVALCDCLGAPSHSAITLFAMGRLAGWIAHIREQRQSPTLLRPRARYVGP